MVSQDKKSPPTASRSHSDRPPDGEDTLTNVLPIPNWHPAYLFLVVVSVVPLVADIASKRWAETKLGGTPGILQLWPNHLAFVLAKNRGAAWGLLQGTTENVRRPFFLLVSMAAITFIVSIYRRLHPEQRSLRWGLPLVLGGALGNLFDRIRYGVVIDFIDAHAVYKGHDHHWPTFNVADIAICIGVGLISIDVFTRKKKPVVPLAPPRTSGFPILTSEPSTPPPVERKP